MDRSTLTKACQARLCIQIIVCLLLCTLGLNRLDAATATPVPITLSSIPMNLSQGVPPNILLTLDTSGSMNRFYLPDSLANDYATLPQDQNSDFNYLYYNPSITYKQSVNAGGKSLPNGPTFNAAWENGYDHTFCANQTPASSDLINLASQFPLSWYGKKKIKGVTYKDWCLIGKKSPAFYYARTSVINNNPSNGCSYPSSNSSCYVKITLTNASNYKAFVAPSTRTDCTGTNQSGNTTCTFANESQNFANWFSYYRSRILMAKTTASLAFSTLNDTVRVTHQTLYSKSIPSVKIFSGTDRTAFFKWLRALTAGSKTPLRQALDRAGKFFSLDSTSTNDPYLNIPGDTSSGEYSCRQNYNILITDGMWNVALNSTDNNKLTATVASPGDLDNSSTQFPDGTNYSPQLPYADNNGGTIATLADFAFKYWATDLRQTLINNVPAYKPTSKNQYFDASHDPANWQHLVNFMIPLGLTGNLTYSQNNKYDPFINNGTNSGYSDWPEITQASTKNESSKDKAAKVDDLWHAAIDSRGEFYSAKNPAELTSALTNIFSTISTRKKSSSAGAAVSAAQYMAGNYVYQPSYKPGDWYGDLVQYDITKLNTQKIYANSVLKQQDNNGSGRNIITYNDATNTGVPFEWSTTQLSTTEQTALSSTSASAQDVLNYLRGDQSQEQANGGAFRDRTFKLGDAILGDIVHSTPVYVGPPDLRYPDSIASSSGQQKYSAFVSNNKSREPMVWVGANDGMLHGFDAKSLKELVAYVPSSVYPNLPALTKPTYRHHYYVDGSPTESDVMFSDNNWHSILVGGLNAGGRGIYALDITDPTSFSSETSAASDVLWEFNSTNAPDPKDLGYTYSQPQISKMNNGQWAVIFGNGYNSPNGDAVLFIVNAETGALIKKIDTGVGPAQDPTGKHRLNGLSSVTLADNNADFKTDYIYAGDLYGNLWKFDVSGSSASSWTVENESVSGKSVPLFSTNGQPITTAPVVAYNAYQHGYMVLFGTGSYLSPGDLSDLSIQSFYGIWDRNQEATYGFKTITPSDTLAQTIKVDNFSQFSNVGARVTSNNAMKWYTGTQALPNPPSTDGYLGWHIDFVEPNGVKNGERVTTNPQVVGNRVIFITNTLNTNPCDGGSYSSWLMELNASTGQPLPVSPFDYNGDGKLAIGNGGGDLVDTGSGNYVVGSGMQFKNGGQLNAVALASGGGGNEVKIGSKGNGSLVKINEPPPNTGLRSWIELQ